MARARGKKVKKKKKDESVGGLAFFCSLFFLLVLGVSNITILVEMWDAFARERTVAFAAGILLGSWFASQFVNGKWNVLVHEYKHAILALLVGNRWKGIDVQKDSGHFKYSYSKQTATAAAKSH